MMETLARAVADAFMQVGVYVGLMLVFFGWLQWRTGERSPRSCSGIDTGRRWSARCSASRPGVPGRCW